MVTEAYRKYLKSPQWQAKRQEVFRYYGKRCYACRTQAKVLHVHDCSYRKLGNEPMSDLMPLCVPCHDFITKFHRKSRRRGLRYNTMLGVKLIRKNLHPR